MQRRFVVLTRIFLAGLLVLCSYNVSRAESVQDSIFWEAQRNGQTIFILGVAHVGFKSQYPLSQPVLDAFDKASLYITESVFTFADRETARKALLEKYTTLNSKDLQALMANQRCANLHPFIRAFANDQFGSEGFEKLSKYSPRALVHQLYQAPMQLTQREIESLNLAVPVEFYLAKRAVEMSKRHSGLDPEYWEALDDLSDSEMCELVGWLQAEKLRKQGNELQQIKQIERFLLDGNSVGFNDLLNPDDLADQELTKAHRKWFENRNRIMAKTLLGFNEQRIFVCIGAAHLAGERGVLELLKANGYEISPKY